jgi:hypothetical protein
MVYLLAVENLGCYNVMKYSKQKKRAGENEEVF